MDPKRKVNTLKSIQTGKLFFSGPLILKQNNEMAIIARKPIYTSYSKSEYPNPNDSSQTFWGFITVLCETNTILEHLEFNKLYTHFHYTFRLYDSVSGRVIYHSSNIDADYQIEPEDQVNIKVEYTDAGINWVLQLQKQAFWTAIPTIFYLILLFIFWKMAKLMFKPYLNAKTALIR